MTGFYLKTSNATAVGPYTSLELREAALAQLVLPDTGVASTADGPWMRAADIGLFSDKNNPVPYPPGMAVPEFRLAGVNEAFQGPFKLRELVDFAVRKILPGDATIQPVGRPDWIPVNQFGILEACLRGEVSRSPNSAASPPVSPDNSQRVGNADLLADPESDIDSILSRHREQLRKNVQERIANKSKPKFQFKIGHAGWLVLPLVIVGLVWWIMQPPSRRTDRSKVIGDWGRIPSHEKGRAFGISFKEDGTCVVFNSDGDCWSGDFQLDNTIGEAGFQPLGLTNSEVADISTSHRSTVKASDGYVRLEGGGSRKPPTLEGKTIRECFVRRDEDFLWIGYLATGDSQSLDARWVQLWPSNRARSFGSLDADTRGTDLLALYGVPDEARALQPIEITANSDPDFAEPRSLVRYGTKRLTLFADGSVHRFKDP